jgi:hypothetical protein
MMMLIIIIESRDTDRQTEREVTVNRPDMILKNNGNYGY